MNVLAALAVAASCRRLVYGILPLAANVFLQRTSAPTISCELGCSAFLREVVDC